MNVKTSILLAVLLGVALAEDLKCAETLQNASYNGSLCTLHNITVKRNAYDWSLLNQTELQFVNSTISFIPTGLQRHMAQFRDLNFTRTHLQFIDFGDLKNAKHLKSLILRENNLDGLYDNVFRDVAELELLDVSYNQIRVIEGDAFKGLVSITHLRLEGNLLTRVYKEFRELVTLEVLTLNFNLIETVDNEAFDKLTELQSLKLRSNRIEELKIDICVFEHLALDISNNSARGLQLAWNHDYLESNTTVSLSGSHNFLTHIVVDKKLRLQDVELPFNNFSNILAVTNFQHLLRLNLSHNNISHLPFDLVRNLSHLQTLDMSFNRLASVNASGVSNMLPDLRFVGLTDNDFNCSAQMQVKQELQLQKVETDLSDCVLPTKSSIMEEANFTSTTLVSNSTTVTWPPVLEELFNFNKTSTESANTTESSSEGPKVEETASGRFNQIIKDYGAYIILGLLGVIFILLLVVISLVYECRKRDEIEFAEAYKSWIKQP